LVGRTELALERECQRNADKARGLLALMTAQDLLHRGPLVVIPEERKDALKIPERVFVGLQE
jgi:hypothetical protein